MSTLGEIRYFSADGAIDRLSVRNDAAGETSLVISCMPLTKPSGKDVVLILDANDEEQSRLIMEAIETKRYETKFGVHQ
jgi:hypothetical protein